MGLSVLAEMNAIQQNALQLCCHLLEAWVISGSLCGMEDLHCTHGCSAIVALDLN